MCAPVPTRTVSLVAVLPTAVGNDGIGRDRSPAGDVAYLPFQMWYLSLRLDAVKDRYRRVTVSSRCRRALAIWRAPWFLAVSGTMGIVTRRVVVTTDASTKGWGAVCEGRDVNGLWSVTEAASHINVLELRTVVLALRHFLPRLSGQHVLVRTDNTAALAYTVGKISI